MKGHIFVMTHKKFVPPEDPVYIPLHVGRKTAADLGYQGDDTGDSISDQNPYFSELTGMYWIWKNWREDGYVGMCHYRRYLMGGEGKILTDVDFQQILGQYDIITSKRLQYDYSYYDGYASAHNIHDLDVTGEVIRELFPDYYPEFLQRVHGNEAYFGNIIAADRHLFDAYASWLFAILSEVQKRIRVSDYDEYHRRVFGFLSEFLLLVWVSVKKLRVYECMVGMTEEKHETREMKERAADFLARGDIQGARNYFEECLEKRPDVLLEASDTTGELRLSMQVISTCEYEKKRDGTCITDRISDFSELMTWIRRVNGIVSRYRNGREKREDADWLISQEVSITALEIAVMLQCFEEGEATRTLERLREDLEQK